MSLSLVSSQLRQAHVALERHLPFVRSPPASSDADEDANPWARLEENRKSAPTTPNISESVPRPSTTLACDLALTAA